MAGWGTAYLTQTYKHSDTVHQDVSRVMKVFTDLRPDVDTCGSLQVAPCQIKHDKYGEHNRVTLATGQTYNIPVLLWIKESHPYDSPCVFVRPTDTMVISPNTHVNDRGIVDLPYLHHWKYPDCDLLSLVQILSLEFGERCPVSAKVPGYHGARTNSDPDTIVVKDAWWTAFLSQTYKHSDIVYQDVSHAIKVFSDLRPGVDTCGLDADTQRQLLTLSGTIPVVYKGQTYNIPVSLWIKDSHPYDSPCVFVRPTDTMVILPNTHVNDRGIVDLPYLHHWKYPDCDLLSLIQILSLEFGDRCPVSAKVPDHGAIANSGYKDLLLSGLSKEYINPGQVIKEIDNILKTFSDLRPDVSVYATGTSSPKELLRLEGTIPVVYKGNQFNIPVCLWIMPTHPVQSPDVYVCPTNTMRISPSDTVDTQGRITLPCLQDWDRAGMELLNVVQILCSTFSQVSPVFSLVGGDGVLLAFHQDKRFKRQYQNPDITKTDVLNAVGTFNTLKPKFDWAVDSSRGSQMELLNLEGTIRVPHKGSTYNIPIWIWIRETKPYHPPLVYVHPTPAMTIQVSNHVNTEGKVDIPYLQQWKYPGSDLPTLIHSLMEVFAKECPVYARLPLPHLTAGPSSGHNSAFPSTWTDIESDRRVFPVNQTSEEFISVVNDFMSSLDAQQNTVSIVKIERIQTKNLYQQFQIEKDCVDKENPGHINERNLWHGTTDTAIANINRYGFNRSYCGRNATVYGQGVYFAVKSSYSACNTYSPPDSQGIKYIYRAKVLTGRSTLGNPSMKDTPLLDPARSVRFHSTTNDVNSPAIFASFRDVHSYPEYLIAFRMSSD